MEWNKYNEFYYKKSFTELIDILRSHRVNIITLDKDWFEALLLHIKDRSLSEEEKEILSYTLSTDPIILKAKTEQQNDTAGLKLILSSPELIISAGKALKNIALLLSIFWSGSILLIIIIMNSQNINAQISTYYILGALSVIVTFILISLLYSAGKNLENSITE
jgi:hypothetical protein